jgi:hypothetical protein
LADGDKTMHKIAEMTVATTNDALRMGTSPSLVMTARNQGIILAFVNFATAPFFDAIAVEVALAWGSVVIGVAANAGATNSGTLS